MVFCQFIRLSILSFEPAHAFFGAGLILGYFPNIGDHIHEVAKIDGLTWDNVNRLRIMTPGNTEARIMSEDVISDREFQVVVITIPELADELPIY
jgi:hypothetical protein